MSSKTVKVCNVHFPCETILQSRTFDTMHPVWSKCTFLEAPSRFDKNVNIQLLKV